MANNGKLENNNKNGKTEDIKVVVPANGVFQKGLIGIAGAEKPGPNVVVVAYSATRLIFVKVLYSFLHSFFGLLAIDGLGLAELAPPGEAFEHLYTIAGIALAPTTLALLQQLYQYLGRLDAKHPEWLP